MHRTFATRRRTSPPPRRIVAALTVVALAVTQSPMAAAQGTVDQSNDPEATTTFGCGSSGASLYQSFTPAARNVAAVALRYRIGGSFPPGGASFTIRLRADGPGGAGFGEASTVVPGPQSVGASVLVRFDMPAPVPVTPGATYVIEQVSVAPSGTPAATIASWFGRDDDPYPRGTAFGCTGGAVASRDHNFVTYAAQEVLTPPPLPAAVCPQIVRLVPRADIERALANPTRVGGYRALERPGLPPGPHNRRRERLTLRCLDVPYDPLTNGLAFKAHCP